MGEPDMEWVTAQLERFIEITKPHNLSREGVITPRAGAAVPDSQVIDEQDTIEAILARFYPRWRDENPLPQLPMGPTTRGCATLPRPDSTSR